MPIEEMGIFTRRKAVIPDRHEHPDSLILEKRLGLYTCSGCNEYGTGRGYKCKECECILHELCATIGNEVHRAFLPPGDHFQFHRKTQLRHDCDACGELVRGFVFKSRKWRLHPSCVKLPIDNLKYSGRKGKEYEHRTHRLKLVRQNGKEYVCSECEERNSCWAYRCQKGRCRLTLDLDCVKVDLQQLRRHGITTAAPSSQLKKFKEVVRYIKPLLPTLASLTIGVASIFVP
eukprot:Gb_08239 [translate_table: standard]